MNSSDTIAAIATAVGEGGIGVIRISGPQALEVASQIFHPVSGGDVQLFGGYTVHYGTVFTYLDGNSGAIEEIDDALLTVFRSPRSYTAENVCEISCHGGSATLNLVIKAVLNAGARLAEPGEFTMRAFLNGRIDLAQAEAVSDLVRASNEAARRAARRQLDGSLSRAVSALREALVGIIASIEVTIDFSDEVGDLDYVALLSRIESATLDSIKLLGDGSWARLLRDGLAVAIVGRPNVGKSSLLNALVGTDRAIVTETPGTTRDTIQEYVMMDGVPVVLTDTAGIRATTDTVEGIGVERARNAASQSDVILFVLDASVGITEDDTSIAASLPQSRTLIVWNKSDLVAASNAKQQALISNIGKLGLQLSYEAAVFTAARDGFGIESLKFQIAAPYRPATEASRIPQGAEKSDPIASAVVASERHRQALVNACNSLEHAVQSTIDGVPGDFIAIDIRGAIDALGLITGETITDEIVHRIFHDFCVGK